MRDEYICSNTRKYDQLKQWLSHSFYLLLKKKEVSTQFVQVLHKLGKATR